MGYTTGKRARIVGFLSDNADKSYTIEEICSALIEEIGRASCRERVFV